MNWDAIGAIGEIAGALAVVISLVYLAIQIRVSNQATRDASHQEAMDQYLSINNSWSSSVETSELYLRGMRADSSLSEAEQVRFRFLLQSTVLVWERIYYLNKDGSLDPWLTHQVTYLRAQITKAPGFKNWYEIRKDILSEEFRKVLEKEIEAEGEYKAFGLPNE